MAANLFGPRAAQGAQAPRSSALVEFRAGKMFRDGELIKPDARKGKVSLVLGDDGLVHFQWKDRAANSLEDDLMIFPEEAKFSKVDKVTSGRVYMLDFQPSGSRTLFFWMQEPTDAKDAEFASNINKYINDPQSAAAAHRANQGSSSGAGGGGAADLMAALGGGAGGAMNPQMMALLSALGGGRGGAGGAGAGAGGAAGLQGLLSALGGGAVHQPPVRPSAPAAPAAPAPAAAQQAQPAAPATQPAAPVAPSQPAAPAMDPMAQILADFLKAHQAEGKSKPLELTSVLSADAVTAALRRHPDIVTRLLEFLPPPESGDEMIEGDESVVIENVRSAQFRQCADLVQEALSSGQFVEILTSLGLKPSIKQHISGLGVTEQFLNAVQDAAPQQPQGDAASSQEQQPPKSGDNAKMDESS